jgi:hypothetical protein
VKHAALRGLILGLILSAFALTLRPSFEMGFWIAKQLNPPSSEVYLNVR